MLIDEIILLALYAVVEILGILQYYPTSSTAIKTNALASGSKRYVKGNNTREQFLTYLIDPDCLEGLWQDIQHRIEGSPRFTCFRQITLFLNQKNCKLSYMKPSLHMALRR